MSRAMPDTRFQSDAAQVVAVFVECIFYGIYLVTFLASLKSILWSGSQRTWASRLTSNRSMFLVIMVIFTISTLNLALGLVRLLQGLIYHTQPGGGAIAELGQDWINIVKPLTVHLQTITADVVLIHRCWIMCDKSYRMIIFPVFLWLGGVAVTALSMYMQGVLTSGSRVNGGTLSHVYISFWSATITINIYATAMIVLRIWRSVRETAMAHRFTPFYSPKTQSRLQNIIRIIIESGLIYTAMSIIVFVTQLSGSNSVYITTAAEIQLTGIAFNLILIRAKKASDQATTVVAGNISAHISFTYPTNGTAPDAQKHDSTIHTNRGTEVERVLVDLPEKCRDISVRHSSSF
ncbi:hypothetical protein FPV67DRAFT_1490019 [Lyophyllum atratum]|nr:hypothetical protein FPV67DRAFT_1490019 [Lyophyllum atratum]